MTIQHIKSFLLGLCLAWTSLSFADTAPRNPSLDMPQVRIFNPVVAHHGIVASPEALAGQVGLTILKRGGNAVDAAVAVGFALAATLPKAGNIGGGGFMLVHHAKSGKTIAIDYRETAPRRAHRDMFLDAEGKVDEARARFSYQSVAVPGTVAGLLYALEHYGTMSRKDVMAPAIALAGQGFIVSDSLAASLKQKRDHLNRSEAARRTFLKPSGETYQVGERWIQSDLAWSLREIAEYGVDAFYRGSISKRLVADSQAHGGILTARDFERYRVIERTPLRGYYRGYEVVSMPPPSSGGAHLIQMLNILEGYPLQALGHNSAASLHVLVEVMKRAYADRSKYLGDPDFVKIPLRGLQSKEYAKQLRLSISQDKATPSQSIQPGDPHRYESEDTTHFSVMDAEGNAVANTYTLNFAYGSGHVAAGTGILLNNEMDDFAAKPGVPNAYGLLGDEANEIAPYKRPLSSMTPTIVFKDHKPYLVTGSPGGSTIITVVLQTLLNVLDYGMDVASASSVPRVHHQWLPDQLHVEPGISIDTQRLLQSKGHQLVQDMVLGNTQTLLWDQGVFYGASDPRQQGVAVGY